MVIKKVNKKIIFFANFPPPYNGQTMAMQINYNLLKDEFELYAIDTSSGKYHIGRGFFSKIERLVRVFKNYFSLYFKIRELKPDHLYIITSETVFGHLRDWITILIASKQHIPITAHVHSGNFDDIFKRNWHKKITQYLTSLVDTYIFLSESLAQRVNGCLKESQIKIIQNTTESSIYCTDKEIEEKIIKNNWNEVNVTYLSNMIPSKGYMDLLKAISLFKEQSDKNIKVNFIGYWPKKKDLMIFKQAAKQLKIMDNIIIWGAVKDRKKIKNQFLKSDVFVLPTYFPVEAQPITIIEAMNAATPIVSTRHASIPDYVVDDKNGYLVKKKSPRDIAKAMVKLSDKENWTQKALAARKTYKEKFSPDVIKDKLIKHFGE